MYEYPVSCVFFEKKHFGRKNVILKKQIKQPIYRIMTVSNEHKPEGTGTQTKIIRIMRVLYATFELK